MKSKRVSIAPIRELQNISRIAFLASFKKLKLLTLVHLLASKQSLRKSFVLNGRIVHKYKAIRMNRSLALKIL